VSEPLDHRGDRSGRDHEAACAPPSACRLGVTSDKTHVEHNQSALTLIADTPADIISVAMGPIADLRSYDPPVLSLDILVETDGIETAMTEAPASQRACEDCTLCCKVMAIDELEKPAGSWCHHCKIGSGCKRYTDRPAECRFFNCLWLIDERLGPQWKPNKSKIVLTNSEDGLEIRCDPGSSDAWRKEPFRTQISKWAEAGEVPSGMRLEFGVA
jgi:hypothetical protein